jgi:hypothetical protein
VARLHQPVLQAGSRCRRGTVQEGHSFWPGWTAWGGSSITVNGGRSSFQRGVEHRGARPNSGRGKAKWAMASSATIGSERSLRRECSDREQGQHVGLGDRSGRSNRNGLLTCRPEPLNNFQISNSTQTCKFKKEAFPYSKNIKTLNTARFEYFEQLYTLGRFQILNMIHVINSGTEFNLNLP